jgi:thioredoxin-like negative regulator of GroEL
MDFLDVIDTPSCNQFNALIMKKPTVVQFFSAGCGFCHQLEPEWNSLKDMLKEKYKGDMMLARVREDMMGSVKCDKDIEGFPTIFVLKKGKKKKEFVGDRNSAELLEFIEKNIALQKKTQKGGRRVKKNVRSSRRRRRRYKRRKTKRKRRRTRKRRRKSRRIKRRRG